MKKINKSTKKLLFENMLKNNPDFKVREIDEMGHIFSGENYKIKVDKIKAVLDNLLNIEEYDSIDSLYYLLVDKKIKPKYNPAINEIINSLNLLK